MKLMTHLALAGALAAVLGALQGATAAEIDAPRAALVVVGLGIAGTAGALLGAVQFALFAAVAPIVARLGLDTAWHRAAPSDPDAPREPVIRFHAAVLGALVGLLGYAVSLWVVLPRILHIDDESFAREFGVLLLALAVLGAGVAGLVITRASTPIVALVDRRVRLPWPHITALRWTLWLGIPTALFLVPYLRRNSEDLGIFALPFWLIAFFVAQLIVHSFARKTLVTRPVMARRLHATLLAAITAALASSALLLRENEAISDWTRSGGTVSVAGSLLRSFGDFDRDGYSAWLGGGDCAPFDADVNPGSRDVPGNETDENCDGSDARGADANELVVYSQGLNPKQVKKHNVVLIVVDALRWDHTGLSGYKKDTTPYLNEIAKESLVFRHAYSQSSATMLSIPSILTGRDPSGMTWQRGKRLEPAEEEITISQHLHDLGYSTGIVAVKYFADFLERMRTAFEHDAIVRQGKEDSEWFTGRAGPVVVESIRYVEKSTDTGAPFFLTIYIPEPHATYDKHGFGISQFGSRKTGLYDGEIANADRHIGFFIEYLKYRDLWDDTVVVITSDHGEEFNEHGGTKHARTCYVESTHVPLVVHIPGIEHAEIDTPVGLVDIVPTVLEAIGATEVTEGLDGQSLLVPALAPELVPADRPIPCAILSQRAKQGNFFRRALRTGKWLLVHEALANEYELYDTEADPKEKKNVYAEHEDDPAVARLREQLNASLTGNLQDNLLTD